MECRDRKAFRALIDRFNRNAVDKWNDQDLESFCEGYSAAAVMATSAGIFRSQAAILRAYNRDYPDRSKMGRISVEIEDIEFPPELNIVSTASCVVKCRVEFDDESVEESYSMISFITDPSGQLRIMQDVSTSSMQV
ncbi:MAG: hypothetical protein JWL88_664 [Parcubacteria group bacterium]|nr:hypothetical protein [Parcubacteria group bacterium]